ncbi:hypothetical protein KVT40_006835 [Elsinoe batatas]|uniref:DNA replication factor Cdt1 C-terminal domain-containing protein n=1 Tax=Elsinoe batatas TaxID=2601811 RepID=A0A8K0KW87_9PEZI|nr:hypothetical protein KVT40_006835 [Elsinoe batatas]
MAAATMSRKRKAVEDVSELLDGAKGRTAKTRRTGGVEATKPRKKFKSATRRVGKLVQDHGKEQQTEPTLAASKKVNKRQRSPEPTETPRHKRVKDAAPPTPEETPTRGTSRLFDRLNLFNTAAITSTSKNLQAYQSPPETPHSHALKGATDTLPTEVEDLKQQFTAFLNAHALFVAHHGAGSPCALPELASRVTQSWKKRAVSIDDIRRLVAIVAEASPFLLIDNGEGMICLEMKEGREGTSLQNKQLIDEFSRRLQRRWLRWSAAAEDSTNAFLTSLPLAPIMKSEVATDPSKQSKGAYRLAQLKVRPTEATAASTKKVETVTDEAKTSAGVSSRGASLLDRILAKQAALAAGPGGPTKEQLDRLAALDKVEDVTRILDFLAGGRPRASFSMQAVIQHLQSSMRSPTGREEAERVVEVMAQEICPRFVQTVKAGRLYGVVVTKMGRPLDLQTRLDAARSKSS